MTEMDWPISEESLARAAERTDRGRQVAERLFGTGDDPADTLHIIERGEGAFAVDRKRSPFGGRRVAILVGVCSVGLLLYGSAAHLLASDHSSVTQRLPSAAASASAVNSLPPPNLLRPLSPEEAVKENSERPFVTRPDTAASRFVLRTDAEDSDRALTCLTQAVYYEAASEGADGGRAVAQIVLNRMRHPGYPASVCGVVYQGSERPTGCQFTFTCDGSLLRAPVEPLWARSRKIAQEALAGRVFAPIGHATHYHADYVLPYWADSLDKSVQIGRHIFYRLRSSLGDSHAFFQRYAGAEPVVHPDKAILLRADVVTGQLASALISDGLIGSAKEVETAAAGPSSPLLIDSSRGTLLSDAQVPPAPSRKAKPVAECSAGAERKQIAPLSANDLRASKNASGC